MTISIGRGGNYAGGVFGLGSAEDGGTTRVTNSAGNGRTARGGGGGKDSGGGGWSGGGGNGGAGGYNGGNGGSGWFGSGGSGQGTRLPSIQGVTITPGAGGERECSGCSGGGGGGGIIINGGGRRGRWQAQGYGSGGGEYGNNGYHGAVIIYV